MEYCFKDLLNSIISRLSKTKWDVCQKLSLFAWFLQISRLWCPRQSDFSRSEHKIQWLGGDKLSRYSRKRRRIALRRQQSTWLHAAILDLEEMRLFFAQQRFNWLIREVKRRLYRRPQGTMRRYARQDNGQPGKLQRETATQDRGPHNQCNRQPKPLKSRAGCNISPALNANMGSINSQIPTWPAPARHAR